MKAGGKLALSSSVQGCLFLPLDVPKRVERIAEILGESLILLLISMAKIESDYCLT